MYQEFFNLDSAPFDLAPDPRFLFKTVQHARAAANVRFALLKHDSFVVITGEIGTGKTTVLNEVLQQLGPQFVTARLVHTTLTDIELLQALLSEFGIANYGDRKVQLLDELRNYFLQQHLAGRHVVIIVDEAQHLSPAALEELRLLSCIDTHDRRILTIVLTGQPSLDDVVDDPTLAQLRQRTRLRQRLRPLNETDTHEYIRHRLRVAGGNADDIFAPESIPEIHRLTLGTPRLINTLCDTALTSCMVEQRKQVDLGTLASVVTELGWRWPDAAGRREREPGERGVRAVGAADRAFLSVYSSGKLTEKLEIRSVPFSIGRGDGNDLVVQDQAISRFHAVIDRVDGRYIIEDHNSRNGLMVNHRKRDTAVLKSGDVITIAHIELYFRLEQDHRDQSAEAAAGETHGARSSVAAASHAHAETQRLPEAVIVIEDFDRIRRK